MVAPFAIYPKSTVSVRILPIAKTLAKRGYEVVIVIPPYDNPSHSGRKYEVDGVEIYNVAFRDFKLIKYVLTPLRIVGKIFSLKPNIVYVFKPKGYSGLVAMFLGVIKGLGFFKYVRLVLDMDDWEGYGGFSDYFLARSVYPKIMLDFFDFQEKWIPRHVNAITVASKTLEKRVLGWGVSPNRVFYVPNGIFKQTFSADHGELAGLRGRLGLDNVSVILLYTRFFEYDLKKVVEVLKYVTKDLGDVKLLVVGKGDFGEEEKLKELASEEGVKDLLAFAGWVKPDDIPKYLALGDVAIYPFDDTPLNRAKCPRKLVELMVAGKSVVAERVGQIAEYIKDDESGILVNHDDIKGFASAVVKVLKDSALKRSLGMNAQRRILKIFNWDRLVDGVERAISFSKKKDYIDEKKPYNALEVQRELELRIKNLLEENAPIEELQKAYDEFHSHLLKHGIRGRPPQGYLYKRNLSLIDQLFLEKIGRKKSVLEIGVGDGCFLIACSRKGNLAKGLDISEVVIRRLRATLEKEKITAVLKLGDARHLNFPDHVFDHVVSKDLIEHIPGADLQLHLREVWRVLKPNGCYLVWTPSKLLGHTSLGSHLKEYSLSEAFSEFSKAHFKPTAVNLYVYMLLRRTSTIPRNIVLCMIKYENILEKLLQKSRINIQHPLFYLIAPPICVAAYKIDSQNSQQRL